MCSRQVFAQGAEIAAAMGLELSEDRKGLDNAAPTDETPVITLQEPKLLQYFSWGFPWRDRDGREKLTTCLRSETILEKAFGKLLKENKRCLSISKGFFEFSKTMKEPYFFTANDQPYTIIAGLWNTIPDLKTGERVERYAIMTTRPNSLVSETHDRMPVILTPVGQATWLNPEATIEELMALLVPYDQDNMDVKIASKELNNSKNKDFKLDKLIDPKDKPPPAQGTLF